MNKIIKILAICTLTACSENKSKNLIKIEKCADQEYAIWNEHFTEEKLSKVKMPKKLESPVYEAYFDTCEHDLKENPLKFEAKYLQ